MNKILMKKFKEAILSVLPISAVIVIISIFVSDMTLFGWIGFFIGVLLLILGMTLYSLGVDTAIEPVGMHIGAKVSHFKKLFFVLLAACFIGVVVTIAEPDLTVLAEQVPSISKEIFIITIALGVGIFLLLGILRIFLKIKYNIVIAVCYAVLLILVFFLPKNIIPLSFDSGGVTTGPITVPFIMAMGLGISTVVGGKNSDENSFGLAGICSVGPILSVALLGLFYKPSELSVVTDTAVFESFKGVIFTYLKALPIYFKDIAIALSPIFIMFILAQIFLLKLPKKAVWRIVIGFFYTYIGIALFLAGVNVGFMPSGKLLGYDLSTINRWLIIPVGMIVGAAIVLAEPAVHVLTKQVENLTNGAVKRKTMLVIMSISMAIALGFAMLRVATGINILYVLIPFYVIAVALTFVVKGRFGAIAFDSGGVASGPMTATFVLPFALGACVGVGGDIMTDAFGVVAMVAMTPLVTVQFLGLYYELKLRKVKQIVNEEFTALLQHEGEIIEL